MAACSVKLLFLIFIYVLREATASPRNDAIRELQPSTQQPIATAHDIIMKSSTDPGDINRRNSLNPNDLTKKISSDSLDSLMDNFTDSNSISMENSTYPGEITMEYLNYSHDVTLTNSTDPNDITIPNSPDPNNISLENSTDPNDITITSFTYQENISMENSTDSNAFTTENSNDPNNVITENSDPIDISMENYTKPNDTTICPNGTTMDSSLNSSSSFISSVDHSTDPNAIRMVNSTVPNDITLENSTEQNDVIMETSNTTNTQTCIIPSGFTADNVTATVHATADRGIIAFVKCLYHIWLELPFSKMHQPKLTLSWNRSHNNINTINTDNLEHAKAAVAIWRYCSPILIVAGTIGNILSFAVMVRKKIRDSTTSLYLSVLAVADTAVLYTGLLTSCIKHMNGYDVRLSSRFACKFHMFSVNAIDHFDSWVLVNVTLERVCAVLLPHKVKGIFTKKFATVCLIIQALVIIFIDCHFLYAYDLGYLKHRNAWSCLILLRSPISYWSKIWPWIDLCLTSMVPFIIIVSSNVAIVCRLLWSRYTRRQSLHVSPNVEMTSMTAILITVSTVFLVTTAPLSTATVYYRIIKLLDRPQEANVYQKAIKKLVFAILSMIYYMNTSVNFLLYCGEWNTVPKRTESDAW